MEWSNRDVHGFYYGLSLFDAMQRRFSTYHLTAATHNARIVGEAENAMRETGYDATFQNESLRRWQPIHDAFVVTTFITSFAAVEAAVNEEISRPRGKGGTEIQDFRENYPGDLIREKSTLPKAQLVLRLSDADQFDTGRIPYQDLDLLRKLRNHFVHHQHQRPSGSILDGLETKAEDSNPFQGDAGGRMGGFLSFDCAQWAVESAIEFISQFYHKIGEEPPFSAYRERLLNEMEPDWREQEPQWKVY